MKKPSHDLYPFFCYFGGKWRAARRYPEPRYGHVVEPFAGAAGYSLRYPDLNITLYDLNPVICGMWDYLTRVTAAEVRSLPLEVNHIDDLGVPQEAGWLISFWLNKAGTHPVKTASTWMKSGVRPNSYWGEVIRERIANQVDRIRHWKIVNKSHEEAGDEETTWFIDAPYQGKCGRLYRFKVADYASLGEWCRGRKGQVIVCERAGADWLPFEPFGKFKAMGGPRGKSHSHEVIWTNERPEERAVSKER